MKSNLFNFYKWAFLFFAFLLSYLPAQIKVVVYDSIEEIIQNVDTSIDKRNMEVKINQLKRSYNNLTSYYEDKDFSDSDEPTLDLENAYKKEVYKEEFNLVVDKKVSQRYKRSLEYRDKGNIDKFYEINRDIIMRYPLNIYAAKAAYALGRFEESIYTLEEAKKYYRFVTDSHFNSDVGPLAYIRYALVLAKQSYYAKSEQLLLTALDNRQFEDSYSFIALTLRDNLAGRAVWFWRQKKLKVAQYYLNLYEAINRYVALNKLRLEVGRDDLKD